MEEKNNSHNIIEAEQKCCVLVLPLRLPRLRPCAPRPQLPRVGWGRCEVKQGTRESDDKNFSVQKKKVQSKNDTASCVCVRRTLCGSGAINVGATHAYPAASKAVGLPGRLGVGVNIISPFFCCWLVGGLSAMLPLSGLPDRAAKVMNAMPFVPLWGMERCHFVSARNRLFFFFGFCCF